MDKYEAVIGLEVHVELNTKTKMFCRCNADYFGKQPNTHVCPICLGLPGSLPYINKQAIESCLLIGLALNCSVADSSCLERKNYFYPDLPKSYQISQYRWPLCINGWLEATGSDGRAVKIRVNRVHQEEDTGKLMHVNGQTAIDYNRSSVPLVEIVTEPDFHDVEAVVDYAKKLQQIFRYLGVSNADMERGDMRLEANVSVRLAGATELPDYRIELKNINSFRFMKAAVEYEIKRQSEALDRGEKLSQETRGWDEDQKVTYLQRSKEEAHDYRYFPDPDLSQLSVARELSKIKESLPELPWQKQQRFVQEFGLSEQEARILTEEKEVADIFEEAVSRNEPKGIKASELAKYIVNKKPALAEIESDKIVEDLLDRRTGIIEDEDKLRQLAEEAISENSQSVQAYKSGKEAALQALIGGVMRKSAGKANAGMVKSILEKLLK